METSNRAAFGSRLRNLLLDRSIKQKALAEEVGVSPAAVGHWLRGGDIEYITLRAVATFLGANWVWLRYGEEAARSVMGGEDQPDKSRMKELSKRVKNEARLRETLEAVGVDAWTYDPLSGYIDCSNTCERLLGWPVHSVEEFINAVHPEDRPRVERQCLKMLDTPPHESVRQDCACRVVRPNGEVSWVGIRGVLHYDAGGEPTRGLGIVMELTEECAAWPEDNKNTAPLNL